MNDEAVNRPPRAGARPAPRVLVALALVAGTAWAQGVRVEDGIRFPDGSVQTTSAQRPGVAVRETGLKQCFDAAGVEIACAGSQQDGDARPGLEWSVDGRFIDFGTGVLIDSFTGLMWLRDAGCVSHTGWESALDAVDLLNNGQEFNCTDYTAGTHDDWRMPSITELMSLIDYGSIDAMPAGHPFVNLGVGNCSLLSSTTMLEPEDNVYELAWGVPLANPGHPAPHQVQGLIKDNANNCVLPVRSLNGPMPVAAGLRLAEGGITFGDGSRQLSAPLPGTLLIPSSGQTDCYGDSGLPIQCAGSGQDGETQNGVAWPTPRYVDNGDGTVKDELTGLTWLKDADCDFSLLWQDSIDWVDDLNAGTDHGCLEYAPGSFSDWRLPSASELMSLFDFGSDEGLPAVHPFDFSADSCFGYWSSTSDVIEPDEAWRLLFGPKATFLSMQPALKTFTFCIWPVKESG